MTMYTSGVMILIVKPEVDIFVPMKQFVNERLHRYISIVKNLSHESLPPFRRQQGITHIIRAINTIQHNFDKSTARPSQFPLSITAFPYVPHSVARAPPPQHVFDFHVRDTDCNFQGCTILTTIDLQVCTRS